MGKMMGREWVRCLWESTRAQVGGWAGGSLGPLFQVIARLVPSMARAIYGLRCRARQ